MNKENQTIQTIAPEDITVGDYITITHRICQYLRGGEDADSDLYIQRVAVTAYDAGQPMKVVNVCLPFVLVRLSNETYATVDVRQVNLSRMCKSYAKSAMKCLSKTGKKK